MAAAAEGDDLDVNLTPLLDLILQLIMFFMITVNFVRADKFDQSIDVPIASYAAPIDSGAEDWVFLNLDKDGKLAGTISNLDLDTPQKLKVHLERERQSLERSARARGKVGEVKIVIILRADKNCKYTDVWSVLHSCQQAGFKTWQLRVKSFNLVKG